MRQAWVQKSTSSNRFFAAKVGFGFVPSSDVTSGQENAAERGARFDKIKLDLVCDFFVFCEPTVSTEDKKKLQRHCFDFFSKDFNKRGKLRRKITEQGVIS